MVISGVATGGSRGQSATPDSKKLPKIGKNQENSGEKKEKIGKKRQKSRRFFTLPLLTDRACYATDGHSY